MKIWIDEVPGHCNDCAIYDWCNVYSNKNGQCLFNALESTKKLHYIDDEMFIPVENWDHLKTGDWVQANITDEEGRVRTCTAIVVGDKIYAEYLDYYFYSDDNVEIIRAITNFYSYYMPKSLEEAENCFDQKSVYGDYRIEFLASC